MKIIPEQIINNNRDVLKKQDVAKKSMQPETAAKASACDTITIEAKQAAEITDAQFIAQLKKMVLADIQAGTPEYKLEGLKQQIALDEYDVNIPDIVKKLMNVSSEVGHE